MKDEAFCSPPSVYDLDRRMKLAEKDIKELKEALNAQHAKFRKENEYIEIHKNIGDNDDPPY